MLRAGKIVNSFLNKNIYRYGITPQFMHPLSAELLLDQFTKTTKRTKTVCTIGYISRHSDPKHKSLKTPANLSMKESL